MSEPRPLQQLSAGQVVIVGGDRYVTVDPDLATVFEPGDHLIALADGALLHIPAGQFRATAAATDRAAEAFDRLAMVSDEQISSFFHRFAAQLADDEVSGVVLDANRLDVAAAERAGRSTTRLELTDGMRRDMIAGLRGWRDSPLRRDAAINTVEHVGWTVEARRAPLGIVGFVFEGRPNVFADACGVVRTGNTVVMRIGSDALATAEAIVQHCVVPALDASGLPASTIELLRSRERSAGWALFAQPRLALAVARGSGQAVAQLGGVARQCGTPVSLHGTGGAWLVAGVGAERERFAASVTSSLDRKVCNTLNVCCIPDSRLDLVDVFLGAVDRAAQTRDTSARLHVLESSRHHIPEHRFTTTVKIARADGVRDEPAASTLPEEQLATEWEWEGSPEVSLAVVDDVAHAVALLNRYGPRFIASIVSADAAERDEFYARVDAPFVGDGLTRWVDGQFALDTPELGLSNWQLGRLMARGGVLSGESVYTVRHRATIEDVHLHRYTR